MPPQTRGAAKKARLMNIREQALGIVLSSGLLHWYEAVKVGETCKDMYYEWQEMKDHICEPLLASLNRLTISTNICQRPHCEKIAFPASKRECQCTTQDTPLAHLDPRFYEDDYSQLSTWKKCKTMAEFTAKLVSNFWSNFNLENPTQRAFFTLDPPGHLGLQFIAQEKPRRFAFIMNLMFATCGQFVLYQESSCRIAQFNQAFAENTGFVPTRRFVEDCSNSLNPLFPWTNHMLELIIHNVHDEGRNRNGLKQVWEVLGNVLSRKLDFLATFVNVNGVVLFPGDMEAISNEEEERIREMLREAPTAP